jgi:uncharacterized protein (DUF1697 family)
VTTYAVLLRGINVGGARPLPMAALRTALTDAGFGDVRTYLQSGNVVLTSRRSAASVRDTVAREIARTFHHDVTVIVRTEAQVAAVVAANPFVRPDADPGRNLHVGFLREPASAERITALEARRVPPEDVHVRASEVYLWCPDGLGKSKLAPALERTLRVTVTMRNWRTVTELAAMLAAPT